MNARLTVLSALGAISILALGASCGSIGDADGSSSNEDDAAHGSWGSGGGSATTTTSAGGSAGTVTTTDATAKCGAGCETSQAGAGSTDPFDTQKHESSNVSVGPDGSLALDRAASGGGSLIWIASSAGNVVSKVDTTTFQELGRYATGAGDPSRTSVDSLGNVYVGNRGGASVTKILAAGDKCPDTNGDGQITTSHGANDVLPYGQDDCRVWETPLGHAIRGVAAQDIYTQVPSKDPDLPPEVQEEHYVWAGTLDGIVWKLDAKTGAVLLQTAAPCPVYGFALDGKSQLWMTSGNCVGRIDTTKCKDGASCDALAVCQSSCDPSGACTAQCDGEGKEAVSLPDSTYGITVDFKQRVWLGGGSGLKRYDPHAPAATRYAASQNGFSHGVTADANGFIWGAAHPSVVRLNGDTMESVVVPTSSSKGMAVDKQGKIWAISYQDTYATVITPGPGLNDNTLTQNAVTGLVGPYTYSDMTGLQAALAKNDPGHYLETFKGCLDGDTRWIDLSWEATVPANTALMFRVRTADDAASLAKAKWISAANVPSAKSPVSLDAKFKALGITSGKLLDVDVWLSISVDDQKVESPKVKTFSVSHTCPKKVN
jgi:hypothetical protein